LASLSQTLIIAPQVAQRWAILGFLANLGGRYCLFLLLLCGCQSSSIVAGELPQELYALAEEREKTIHYSVSSSIANQAIGYQFMLVFIPLGRVAAGDVQRMAEQKIFSQLTLCGYKPLMAPAGTKGALRFELSSAGASAYDLVVTRKLACYVELQAHTQHYAQPISSYKEASFYRSKGFSPELSKCMDEALDLSVVDLLSKLGVCRL
jgi:hypothetical protein